jgi:hypothetical protein
MHNKKAKVKVENSAQTTLGSLPLSFALPETANKFNFPQRRIIIQLKIKIFQKLLSIISTDLTLN